MNMYTPQHVSDLLGVSLRTLERWRSSGKFVPVMRTPGGHSRYSKEQVELAQKGVFDGEDLGDKMQELLG